MTDWRKETIDTYNNSATKLAEYFRGIGSRVEDIDNAFHLVNNPEDARVVELGCGDGRDAKEIYSRTQNFTGIDISDSFIDLAKDHVPGARFEVGDAVTYEFPEDLDIIFAFASLLHLDKYEVATVFEHAGKSFRPGGIFYISLKYAPDYEEKIKEDQYGKRKFYFYSPELLEQLAGPSYETVYRGEQTIGDTDWFTMALMKS